MTNIKKYGNIAVAGLLAALAILLGYVEHLIPVVPPIAGIKLGLGNMVVLFALRRERLRHTAVGIMLTKVLVCAVLFGGFGSLPYSLAGGCVSLAVMALMCRCKGLSAAGVSVAGGAAHMAAQVAVASAMTSTIEVLSLFPVLAAVGTLTGLMNGVVVNLAERHISGYVDKELAS